GAPRLTDQLIDELVDSLIARREELHNHLMERLPIVRSSAERNFDVLGELLEGR
ncbi:MAG: hypothetical protein JO199_00945, partial [Candidatus Eremiobacteraeota bacterium]|nr:hypothetical protein [Candidatus Eremiobacteraeota bacterium]